MTALPRPEPGEHNLGIIKGAKVGDTHKWDSNHSQWCGAWNMRIDRIDGGGYCFGPYIDGDVYELDPEDCV